MIQKARVVEGSEKGNCCRVVCLDSDACKNCAGSMFCKIDDKSYEADNKTGGNIVPGDIVDVFFPSGKTVFISFLVLIFPLVCFVALFIIIGCLGISSEILRVLGGFAGILLGFGLSLIILRQPCFRRLPQITHCSRTDKD